MQWENIARDGPQNTKEENFYHAHDVQENLLWKKSGELRLLVVPRSITNKVIHLHHDVDEELHPGRDETLRKIRETYHWRTMYRHVGTYVRNCRVCATEKTRQIEGKAPLRGHEASKPFETISIDVMGPYAMTREGNRYIFAAEDIFTKWVEIKAYPKCNGKTLLKFLEEELISRYGCPKQIVSDNGSCFISNKYQDFCQRSRIDIKYSPVEHQQANPIERKAQEIKKLLRIAMNRKTENIWDNYLPQVIFAMRRRKNAASKETPSKALLGYELALPGSWEMPNYLIERENAEHVPNEELERRQLTYQRRYAPKDQTPKVTFNQGDRVLAKKLKSHSKNHNQFGPQWTGPHLVLAKISEDVYEIDRNGKETRLHIDDLRPLPSGNLIENNGEISSDSESDGSSDEDTSNSEQESLETECSIHDDQIIPSNVDPD